MRVAHYGTGHTGTLVLRQLLQRPDIELVGHLVHTPAKVGLDSGEIVGLDPVGVRATGNFEEFCALDVDCVTYFATEFGRDIDDVIDEMCRLLQSGKNVVTTTYVRLVYPRSLPAYLLPNWKGPVRQDSQRSSGRASRPDSPPTRYRSTARP
jgi:hypothetical protein